MNVEVLRGRVVGNRIGLGLFRLGSLEQAVGWVDSVSMVMIKLKVPGTCQENHIRKSSATSKSLIASLMAISMPCVAFAHFAIE